MNFTQFLRPNGRRKTVSISRSEEIEKKASDLEAAGARFEVEVLTTGQIFFEVVRPDPKNGGETESLASEICYNGPAVRGAVDRLVETAWRAVQ